ncbi:putative ribonuclease H-like domain-containing protein [Tanacetum coccineum]|uniref:Ribonuclease H-like domain-containing protein n=1 Tax=Tanacetum coccineum TaxID=301880 RepID=A0ABQ5BF10_9ASTR
MNAQRCVIVTIVKCIAHSKKWRSAFKENDGIYPVTKSCESYGSDTSLAKLLTEESKFDADVIMAKKDDNKPQEGADGLSEQNTDKGVIGDETRRNEAGTKAGERRKRDGFLKEITMRGQSDTLPAKSLIEEGWVPKRDHYARPVGGPNDGPRLGGPFITPKQRPEIFTADKQETLNEIKTIIQSMRRIMHQSGCAVVPSCFEDILLGAEIGAFGVMNWRLQWVVFVGKYIVKDLILSGCDEFETLMKGRFQMSSLGELTFFLGLQVKQSQTGLFISQDKYIADMLKKFDLASVKTAITPMDIKMALTKDEESADVDVNPKVSHLIAVKGIFKYLKGKPNLGLWYPRESPFALEAFSDSDYAGANLDRKSTTGGCQFLGRRLISWQCKKQTIVATSTTEAEYVAAANCCGQILWIQNQLLDYGFNFMNTKIHIDNESTICIVKNPVFHSKTKHIEIRHHFIRDAYEKKLIQVQKIHTDNNVADLLTKAFDGPRFNFLVVNIGMAKHELKDGLEHGFKA